MSEERLLDSTHVIKFRINIEETMKVQNDVVAAVGDSITEMYLSMQHLTVKWGKGKELCCCGMTFYIIIIASTLMTRIMIFSFALNSKRQLLNYLLIECE